MFVMEFDNWFEKIKSNREHFIEYYVNQFGEENRNLITERFDSLKFCFFINPYDIGYWMSSQLKDDYAIATYQFLKDSASKLDIDISKISLIFDEKLGHISINSNDKNVESKIDKLFGTGTIGSAYIPDEFLFDNLYSFRNLNNFINGEGKEYSDAKEKLLERRLLFLMDMGDITIEGRPIDYFSSEDCKEFVSSPNFKKLLHKYQELAETAFKYKKEVDYRYQHLTDYMKKKISSEQQIIEKYNRLKQGVNNPDKIKEYEKLCKEEIASLRIFCGNFDISNCLDKNVALDYIVDSIGTQCTTFFNDYLSQQEIVIFLCPFRSIPGYEDVDLRHEIRHGITSSLSINGNITTYKIGNKIEKYIDKECVERELSDYNEWVTQIEAQKETKDAFSKGIYIISKPSLKNYNFVGQTSTYDSYLPLFEIIYNALPFSAKQSQIESSNESLYNTISLNQLIAIEKMILNRCRTNDELVGALNNISEQLKSDAIKR